MKSKPLFLWKGSTFSEIIASLMFNKRHLDQLPFTLFMKPLPTVHYRKEICFETSLGTTKEIVRENTCCTTQINAKRRVRTSLSSRDVSKTSIADNYLSTLQVLPTVISPTTSSTHTQNMKYQRITALNNRSIYNNSLAYNVSETGYNITHFLI
jgi:hypothetical protein